MCLPLWSPAHDARDALAALEARAIRDKERLTYNSTLGSVCFFLVVALALLLPSPWRVLNGEWSSSLLVSLLGLAAHGVLALSVVVAFRCAQVQAADLWEQFAEKYLGASPSRKAEPDAPVDRMAQLNSVVNLKSLRPAGSSLSPANKKTASATDVQQRSFFDPPPVTTVEEGKAYMRRLQKASREKEANEESFQSSGGFGGSAGYPGDNFGIYGAGALLPRVYQASGFDPSLRDTSEEKEEDALTTSSNPQVAWAQLEDVGLAMFMHLYVRNIRRLLACHVKDFVEAFIQNSLELNECGVMADVLLRRVPAQALLCPPSGSQLPQQQLTNVSLADMVSNFKRHPAFMSKTRNVYLFEEHVTFDKYLNVGEATTSEFSSLERQEYVLERLIMLSKDRNLDRFRWDKGAITYKGKPWTESLPSDIDILMNVFCCIMDNMLPIDDAKDRPFTKTFFMGKAPRRPFTPQMRSRIYFVKTVQRPPHFKVLAKAVVREIVPCEENCFHAIIVYLHALKKQKAGHLESINMHRIIDQVFDITK